MLTNAIITYTKSHHLLTQLENSRLQSVGMNDWFKTDSGTLIRGSNIAEIMTIREYYAKFPEKAPDETQEFIAPPREEYVGLEKMVGRSHIPSHGLLKGFQRYCAEHPEALKAREDFDRRLKRHYRDFACNAV